MIINTPISLGELLDKISILKIKKKNINDKNKLIFINDELKLLDGVLLDLNMISDKKKKIENFLNQLVEVNSKLWKIEDDIRDCERNKRFNQEFIDLARAVYLTNDQRSQIKLEINNFFGSKIVEIKSYEKY
tara:strand:- start:140 stop:535 length:396 start_codon:yes stop_codon:yes gene_type:complete